ncbi:MAG TPA: DUF2325 domain-containing protein [Xanthobacteraceae bacterium]|nr:DUF2325 domain-containing protein [Xanthobacteraceae bacterium]
MTRDLAHLLSSSGLPHAATGAPRALVFRGAVPPGADVDERDEGPARRTRIWEFGVNLHCSIIGTCLTTAELRHIVEKLEPDIAAASEHDLHTRGVLLASRRADGAKLLHKALDRRHRVALTRFAKAKEAAAVLALWDEALREGDIPGAYWAALTHPATTEEVIKRAFGDVHMLSHLVGAANRADIRRLRQLEADNAALAVKLERQQRQLHEGFAAREATIRELQGMLARHARERAEDTVADASDTHSDNETRGRLIGDLGKRLARETTRRERSEQRLRELGATLAEAERALAAERKVSLAMRQELEVAEQHLAALARPHAGDVAVDIDGLTLLYVGGRAHQIPLFKGLVERAGGHFLHHDGGIEHGAALLPAVIGRADCVAFPMDCISHDAVATIKRLSRQSGRPYLPLRTASLACLAASLVRISAAGTQVAAE